MAAPSDAELVARYDGRVPRYTGYARSPRSLTAT